MLRQIRLVSVALSLMLVFSAFAFGQGRAGSINGTVTDQTGAIVPGAAVTIESTGTTAGFKGTTTADDDGRFLFPQLFPGTYKIKVSVANFAAFSQNVNVSIDRASTVAAVLKPSAGVTEVDVSTDSAVTIDLGDTKIDTNITKDIIDALPKGTNFASLLKIAPNVRPEAQGGGFQIDGASGSENVFVIDGQEVTNFADGTLDTNNNLPFELLQEVQIKSTGFEAEYGGATGGVINAVTAGGNNDIHGNFGVSFRASKLQGRPNQSLNAWGSGVGQFDYFRPNKTTGTEYYPISNLSGPIVKDKVWGSISYAPQISEFSREIRYFNTPGPTRTVVNTSTYQATSTSQYAFTRIDAQPFSRLRAFGTFLWNPRADDGGLPPSAEGLTSPIPAQTTQYMSNLGGRQNSNSWNYQATWTPLDWMVVNFRNGRSFLNEKLGSYGLTAAQRYAVSGGSPLNPCNPVDMAYPTGTPSCRGFDTGNNALVFFDMSTRTTYDADVSFVGVNAGGRHNIKVGYQLNQLFNDVDSGYTTSGRILLYYGSPLSGWTGTAGLPACNYQTYTANQSNCSLGTARMVRIGTRGKASSDNTALYIQDQWSPTNRLTFNLGLRAESEIVPSFGDPALTRDIKFGWADKIAPRFGVAFDLSGKGTSKVFFSYGWFYDRFKYELPRGLFGAETFMDAFADIIPSRGLGPFSYTTAAMLGGRGIIPGGSCPITGTTGWATCEFDRRVPSNAINANPFAGTGAVDENLKAMRQSEYTFGYEQLLGNNFVFAARYTHKQLDRAIEDIGTINDQGSESYVIGNPGQGLACEVAIAANAPCTKAERRYDAVELRLDKRSPANYFYNVSYTWSRLFGNYSGLASSDELGRNSPNVNRYFDLPMLGYNANGVPDNGLLQTDRPHVFKAYGGYDWDWSDNGQNVTRISGFTTIQSGNPNTTVYNLYGVTTAILTGRGDLGRTEMFTESDISLSHRYRFGNDDKFSFEPFVEIRNMFDERNETGVQRAISSSSITAVQLRAAGCTNCGLATQSSAVQEAAVFRAIFNGGIQQFVNAHFANNPTSVNNTYKAINGYQSGRDVRFGFRFRF